MRKIGPVISLVLSGIALCLLALAPLGWRLGWWPYAFGLYRLMLASGVAGAVAVLLALLTLAFDSSQLRPRAVAMLSLSLVTGASLVYVPLQYAYARRTLPAINDITTDIVDPPAFSAVLAARAAERAGRIDVGEPLLSQLQRVAYPDAVPLETTVPVRRAFDEALGVAKSMSGWTIVSASVDTGRIEASQRSRWFGFTDDMVIRVVADRVGSRIDMRSASRKGGRDYGVNAARVRAYMGALRRRID